MAATVTDVADETIKSFRQRKVVPCGPGGHICDYVPFYFAPRSPMLYRISQGGVASYAGGQSALVYLVTTVEKLVTEGLRCVFTNGNAAAVITDFFHELERLDHEVDWPLMSARYWNNTDEDGDRRRRRQAEFLVHREVPIGMIDYIAVIDSTTRASLQSLLPDAARHIEVTVRPDWYY